MNKLKYCLIMLILMPIIVMADMGSPMIIEYDATIKNPDGAKCYVWSNGKNTENGKINYGEKVRVIFEYTGENYAHVRYNNEEYQVKLSDLIVVDDSYDLQNSIKNGETQTLKKEMDAVILADEVSIKSGPAQAFKTLGTIKKGTKLTYKYSQDAYIYVTYEGVSGWINVLDGAVGFKRDYVWIAADDIELKDKDGKVLEKIPANTLITDYYDLDPWSWAIYKVSGESGGNITKHEKIDEYRCSSEQELENEKNLYEKANLNSKVLTKVKKGEKVIVHFYLGHNMYQWAYIEYNGLTGWIYAKEDISNDLLEVSKNYVVEKYDPNKSTVCFNPGEIIEEEPIVEEEPTVDEVEEEKPTNNEIKESTFNSEDVVLIVLLGALLLSLTIVVTLKLVNKKNNKSNKVAE